MTTVEQYNVSEETMAKYFPEGIPEGLTDNQIEAILRGEGLKVTLDGVETTFNADAWYAMHSGGGLARGMTTWYEPLKVDQTWWPEYGKLTYSGTRMSTNRKTVATRYFLGNQDQSTSNQKGRAWCAMKLPSYTELLQAQNETVHTPLVGAKYVESSRNTDGYQYISYPEYVRYSYRNLNTDWNRSYIIYDKKA